MVWMGTTSEQGRSTATRVWLAFLIFNAAMAVVACYLAGQPIGISPGAQYAFGADSVASMREWTAGESYGLQVAITLKTWLVGAVILGLALIRVR